MMEVFLATPFAISRDKELSLFGSLSPTDLSDEVPGGDGPLRWTHENRYKGSLPGTLLAAANPAWGTPDLSNHAGGVWML